MRCKKCQGGLEPVSKHGQSVMLLCRGCKLPHDMTGRPMFSSAQLSSQFNLLQKARDTIKAAHPQMAAVGKTALEVGLIQAFQEVYFAGMKDGVLLAYSQDYQEGLPHDGLVQDPANDSGQNARPNRGSAIFEK